MKIVFVLMLLLVKPLFAAVEYRAFAQPEQEQSYQQLINELRCLVCQNQTIADSNADLAQDLRNQVYQMLLKGQSEQQIIEFMTDRYGDFVLYRPAFKGKTLLLWLGPLLFLLVGLFTVFSLIRNRKAAADSVLSRNERAKMAAILEQGDEQ